MDSAVKELKLQSTSLGFVMGIKEALRIIAAVEMSAAMSGDKASVGKIQRLLTEAAEKEVANAGTYTADKEKA